MELQLKNIGMIKEANVKIDGLTVIAGENDTGKSTVGKALFLQLKTIQFPYDDRLIKDIFNNNISINGKIKFIKNDSYWINEIHENVFADNLKFFKNGKLIEVGSNEEMENNPKLQAIVIETPIVLNFINLFYQITQAEKKLEIRMDFPELMYDLIFRLENKRLIRKKNYTSSILINKKIISIIDGLFQRDERDNLFFNKSDQYIDIINTATGIKYFGILQLLSENGWLNKNYILVLDEPEVHLHPKWQLEMAKVIVELVKNGVKVLVNSHSPYMIEALKRYSSLEDQDEKTNFYLAEDGYIKQINNSNSETLVEIFEKLSQPFYEFEKMDSDSFERLISG